MRVGMTLGDSRSTTEERETAATIRQLGGAPDTLLIADIAGTMERTARKWLTEYCEEDEQSVGVVVEVERHPAMADARRITATATLRAVDGRRYYFDVTAVNERGEPLATGTHERRVIQRARLST